MANILERSGVAEDLFDAMSIIAGRLRGGVAVQTTLVAVLMAAMTGIMGGEIVMLGLIALPQMLRLGYDKKLAMGTICAGGSLATLIPPSVIMIIYGLTANVSISDLFLGGFLPGLLLASLYITYIMIRCQIQPHLAPLPAEGLIQMSGAEKTAKMKGLILPMLLILWVLGSIYGGIATVTEAAAVGVFGAVAAAAARKKLSWYMLQEALRKTMITVGTIIWLILGAVSFVGIYNIIGGNTFVQGLLTGLDLPPLGVIFVIMGILIVLGTFMEWIAIAYITVPIFAPVVVALGFDPIWFGRVVRDEHPDLLPVATLRTSVFLAQERGATGYNAAGDIPGRAALHRAADHRPDAGDGLPGDRAGVAAADRRLTRRE